MSTFIPQLPLSIWLPDMGVPSPKPAVAIGGEVALDCLIIGGEPIAVGSNPIPALPVARKPSVDPKVQNEVDKLMIAARRDHAAGRVSELQSKMEAILKLQPDNAQAHFNLGVLQRDAGNLPEADAALRRAIQQDPQNPQYYLALGEVMQLMRHLIFAAEAYENGLAVDPNHQTILSNLATVRRKQRMPDKVADLSRRLLALTPQSLPATLHQAWAQLWLGQAEEAAETAGRALRLDPQSIEAAVILQISLHRLGRADAAAAAFDDIKTRSIDTWNICIEAVEAYAQFEEAAALEIILNAVLKQQPNFVPALLRMARHRLLSNDVAEGERLMARVAELDPEEGDAQTSVALSMVRNGDYAEGWSRHHWRWKRSNCELKWDLPIPEWDGAPLGEGGLLLWREQGVGDMIMYAAPAIACRQLARKIIIETNIRLRPLLQRSFPDMVVCSREDLPQSLLSDPDLKAHCPIGDLPHLLHLDMDNYPGKDGFLIADPQSVKRLRERYKLLFPGKRLIGISWRSGNSGSAITRSAELAHWLPVLETPDCAFISLQYGNISQDVADLRQAHGFDVHIDADVDPMKDMDIFAAQVAAMDLVISVDNSTVHVAGALGKPCWVMVPSAADWRWLTPDREDTVWYSSLELFRTKPGQGWGPVVARIAEQLRNFSPSQMNVARRDLYMRSAGQAQTYGNLNVAELYYRAVLVENQNDGPALAGLGQVALATGHTEEAIALLRRAVEADPQQAASWRHYARALLIGKRAVAAATALREALSIDNSDVPALMLGIDIHRALEAPEEIANYCARLLRLDPDHREARLNLATMQAANGEFETAETNFRRVQAAFPDDASAAYALGCLALRRGDYAAGWQGYRRRFDAGVPKPQIRLTLPDVTEVVASGASLAGQRLAVRPEPTLRDQIMFSRWLKSLRQETNFVAAEIDPRLVPLLGAVASSIGLFPTGSLSEEDARDLDLSGQVPLADLNGRYAHDAATINPGAPYLQFDLGKAAALRQDYRAALSCDRLIGLCWRGADMAIPLAEWKPILRQSGFGFVSLQPGPAQQELHDVLDSLDMQAVRDPSIDAQSNLRAYAAQLAAMDLVIAIDDVTAHLAGALGVNVVCLLQEVPDWRWLGEDQVATPWYPTMHLYRRPHDGNWSPVMDRIAGEMNALIECGKGGI